MVVIISLLTISSIYATLLIILNTQETTVIEYLNKIYNKNPVTREKLVHAANNTPELLNIISIFEKTQNSVWMHPKQDQMKNEGAIYYSQDLNYVKFQFHWNTSFKYSVLIGNKTCAGYGYMQTNKSKKYDKTRNNFAKLMVLYVANFIYQRIEINNKQDIDKSIATTLAQLNNPNTNTKSQNISNPSCEHTLFDSSKVPEIPEKPYNSFSNIDL